MAYTAVNHRANPSCLVVLIDQAASMSDRIRCDGGKRKDEFVADIVNGILRALVLRCRKGSEGRDYFHVGVIGYGRRVGPVLTGPLEPFNLIRVSEVANHSLRVEQRTKKVHDGSGGLIDLAMKVPVWCGPRAEGLNPMRDALHQAGQAVWQFISRSHGCFPPIVLNISGGNATDGNPEPEAPAIRNLTTENGNALLFNLHVSSSRGRPLQFPASEIGLADNEVRQLFCMSSVLPPRALETARRMAFPVSGASRGFVFNRILMLLSRLCPSGPAKTMSWDVWDGLA